MIRRGAPSMVVLVTTLCALLGTAGAVHGGAAGMATNRTHSGGPVVRVVALGDSVPAGSQCGCRPFPGRYGRLLGARLHRTVHVDDDAQGGATSGDVLRWLSKPGSGRAQDVAAADVVIVEVGANDTSDQHDAVTSGTCDATPGDHDCVAAELAQLRQNLSSISARIAALRQGRPTVVAYLGYWNVFEDGDVAHEEFPTRGLAASRTLTRRVNGVIWAQARADGAGYVDLVAPFRHHGRRYLTSLLAADGNHPSAEGHRLIADLLLRDTVHRIHRD